MILVLGSLRFIRRWDKIKRALFKNFPKVVSCFKSSRICAWNFWKVAACITFQENILWKRIYFPKVFFSLLRFCQALFYFWKVYDENRSERKPTQLCSQTFQKLWVALKIAASVLRNFGKWHRASISWGCVKKKQPLLTAFFVL